MTSTEYSERFGCSPPIVILSKLLGTNRIPHMFVYFELVSVQFETRQQQQGTVPLFIIACIIYHHINLILQRSHPSLARLP